MNKLLGSVLLSICSLALPAAAQCPFTTLVTGNIGTGVGLGEPPELTLALDTTTCEMVVHVDAVGCCNTFPSMHFLVVGQNVLFTPVQLGAPFYPGSEIFFFPSSLYGSTTGLDSRIAIPPAPGLAGQFFFAQSAVGYFSTMSLETEWGVTQTVGFQLF